MADRDALLHRIRELELRLALAEQSNAHDNGGAAMSAGSGSQFAERVASALTSIPLTSISERGGGGGSGASAADAPLIAKGEAATIDIAAASAKNASVDAAAYSFASTALVLAAYCVSGTLLTLANKIAISAFPQPNMLLFIQNGVTLLLLWSGMRVWPSTFRATPPINMDAFRRWLPLVSLFVCMLVSSLFALKFVSAVTLIVLRNLTSLAVAALEYTFLQVPVNRVALVALFGMLGGAVLYGAHDVMVSSQGYLWLLFNIVATSAYQILIKKMVSASENEQLGPFGMSFYNNLISLPMLVVLCLVTGEAARVPTIGLLDCYHASVLAVSCILGFALSVTAFMLNMLISATAMMVANNVNKFAVIALSELLIQPTLSPLSTLGTVLVLVFGLVYAFSKQIIARFLA